MSRSRAEPVGKGLASGLGCQHRLEITADFLEQLSTRGLDRGTFLHELGRVFGEVIEGPTGFFEGVFLAAVRSVGR